MKKTLKLMLMIVTVSTIMAQEKNDTENKYNINSPHTGPTNIDLNFRFGSGYASGPVGITKDLHLSRILEHDISTQGGLSLNGGVSFVWKGLMIDQDVDYLQKSLQEGPVTIKISLINTETSLGFTWNRKPNNVAYGYFYVGLKTWSVDYKHRAIGEFSSTGLGPMLGLRGLKSYKLMNNLSFLYYGSFFISVAPILNVKQDGKEVIQSSVTSWVAFGVGLEQGFGLSIDNLGLAFLVKGKTELLFGSSLSTYSLAIPAAITFNITKGLSF